MRPTRGVRRPALANVPKHSTPARPRRRSKLLTRTTAHGVPLHALPVGEGGHVGVRVHALLHVAAPHALGAAAGALPADRPQGAGRAALLGAVVRCGREGQGQLSSKKKQATSPEIGRQKIKSPVYY